MSYGKAAILICFCLSTAGGLRAQAEQADNAIRFYQWRISRDPDDFFNYDKLGLAYIRKGRETGDVSYYDLAEKALKKSLELEPAHREAVSATAHLASVYLAEHRFREAVDYARKALAFGTGDLSPYSIIGDALLEMGQYDDASAAYSRLKEAEHSLTPRQGIAYLQETRAAHVEFLRGRPGESIQHMRKAVQIAISSQMPAESIAWTQFTLAEELFQTGDLSGAEASDQDALASYPGYHLALSNLARVRAAQGKLQQSIELYRKALAVIPLPAYAAALGDVYTAAGLHDEAGKQYDLVEFIARLSAISKNVYNRELAMFYADHGIKLEQAVSLARKELEARRDIYTWDCLAWALYRTGRAAEAADAIMKALALGTRDALLLFHAGMICAALHDDAKSKEYLGAALAVNPRFHILYSDVAQRTLRDLELHPAHRALEQTGAWTQPNAR